MPPKPPAPPFPVVKTRAPHVQAALAATVQAKPAVQGVRTPALHVQQAISAVQAKAAPGARTSAVHVQRALAPVQAKVTPRANTPAFHVRQPVATVRTKPAQRAPLPVSPPKGSRLPLPPIQPSLRAAVKPAATSPPAVRPAVPASVIQPARRGGKNKQRRGKVREIDLVAGHLAEGEDFSTEDLFPERPPPPEVPNVEVEGERARRKRALLGVPPVDRGTESLVNRMIDNESIDQEDMVLSRRGGRGRFDVVSPRPLLFWRGDSRSPSKVLRTGFSSRLERELEGAGLSNDLSAIIWRASQDDIVNETAVCVARDVRGSMFFPTQTAASIYLYAVALESYVDTRRAQMLAESVETGAGKKGRRKWRNRNRYRYDSQQSIADGEEGGAVWQFGEVATYQVAAERIVGAWRVDREMIEGGSSTMAGIRFRIHSGNLIQQRFLESGLAAMKRQAEGLVSPYADWYPRQGKYLSYQGIVSQGTPDEPDGPRRSHADVFSRAPKSRAKAAKKNRPRPQGRGRQSHR